jgi:pimeloyl-ACP methyl ester carboxylesterase
VDEFWAPTQFPEFTLAMRHLLHKFAWRAPFPVLTVPTLLMSGTRDRFVSRDSLESICRTMPEMRYIEIENGRVPAHRGQVQQWFGGAPGFRL